MKITIKDTDEKRSVLINNDEPRNFEQKQLIAELVETMSEEDLTEVLVYVASVHPESKHKEVKDVWTIINDAVLIP